MNHNKKRNTILIYEMLIGELTKAVVNKDNPRRMNIVSLLREYFGKNRLLRKELEIYKSFESDDTLPEVLVEKLIAEAKKQHAKLNRQEVFREQSTLIEKINKNVTPEVWTNFVPNFRKYATINQVLQQALPPKKQVVLERKLMMQITSKEEPLRTKFPKINNLTIKTFISKFNDEYIDKLNESQRNLLNKYVLSCTDNGLEFKMHLYNEIDNIKKTLTENKARQPEQIQKKINLVLEKISTYSKVKVNKDMLLEIIKIQSLSEELEKR